MLIDPNRDLQLRLVEGRTEIGGRFVQIRRLGANGGGGNFSLVFTALDTQTNKRVVLKVFNPMMRSDAYRVACFAREAEILERFQGRGRVIQLISPAASFQQSIQTTIGPLELQFDYYALERARTDIEAQIEAGRWSVEGRLMTFRSMCRSVQIIHEANVAHRDLKPANFLVMRNRRVKVSDFGTARSLAPGATPILPVYGFPPGAILYTAPEMLASLHDADPSIALKADFFSLGAILFEIFSGEVLGNHLLADPGFRSGLMLTTQVPVEQRIAIYKQLLPQITARYLPSVKDFDRVAPDDVLDRVDEVYRSMANLDYGSRMTEFSRVIRQIELCLLVARNYEKVRKWEQERVQHEERRQIRLRRRQARLTGSPIQGVRS